MALRIILDENLPRQLKRAFQAEHFVTTMQEQGMAGLKNGALLTRLERNFDVFVTADKNLRYQQNLAGRSSAIIELPTNRLPIFQPLFAKILDARANALPNAYIQLAR